MISSIKKVFSMVENNADFKEFEKGEMIIPNDGKELVIDKQEILTTSIVGFFENEVTLYQEQSYEDNYITISYTCLSNEVLEKILMYLINYL